MKTGSTVSGMVLGSGRLHSQWRLNLSRIENIVIVREAETPNNFGQKGYLKFENVTMVRLDVHFLYTPDADTRQVSDAQKPNRRWPARGLGKSLGKLVSSRGL